MPSNLDLKTLFIPTCQDVSSEELLTSTTKTQVAQVFTHSYRRQQALNRVIPDGEVTCRDRLSLAETKRTVPRLIARSEKAAAEVAVASPSITRRMLALSTEATVQVFIEAGTCRQERLQPQDQPSSCTVHERRSSVLFKVNH